MAKNKELTGAELVGKRIKEARQSKGMTLAALGAAVGYCTTKKAAICLS
jgi:transcriptional regulator with XRE-family HTH domain